MAISWPPAGTPFLYPLVSGAALAIAIALSRRGQKELSLAPRERLAIVFGAIVGAAGGAKLPFLLARWRDVSAPVALLATDKTLLGGLVGGYLGVELPKWSLDVDVKTGDSFAAPVAAGIAAGRLGCFVGGCCYGVPTSLPWGVDFGDGVRRHPTQLYELVFHVSAAVLLWRLRSQGRYRRQLMKLYVLVYLAYRFASEFLRPEPPWCFGLTAYQVACMGLAPFFLWLWWRDADASSHFPERPARVESADRREDPSSRRSEGIVAG
ncbi:MAG: prolipoprotein diacylglyceryl transferase [Candidatus Wallbacteria bacterium]|nr:prolipoprotein diacylglyceryl transferase [Candidatus Wallbacteria bacterium]